MAVFCSRLSALEALFATMRYINCHLHLHYIVRYLAPKSGATLKTGLRFVQGHWKWHHLIDRIRVPIRLP